MARCDTCFRHCEIEEGGTGFCGARTAKDGRVLPRNYGRITSLALDPIEKKPLARFFPGTRILSVGSFGCSLRCPFCQNHEISSPGRAAYWMRTAETISPEQLTSLALAARPRGNIGIAYTYNEPLTGWEYVRDTARLAQAEGLRNVLVTSGNAENPVLEELRPYIDAMNIDLKGFTKRYYREVLGGDLETVLAFIESAVRSCHVELTTLVVPGENDSEDEMRALSAWAGRLRNPDGEQVPLHVTRFFPRHAMTDRAPTDVRTVYRLAEVAREHLRYVYPGNC